MATKTNSTNQPKGASKVTTKGGSQVVAFKRNMSFGNDNDFENTINMIPSLAAFLPKTSRKYKMFGTADDGGRYELLLSAIAHGRLKMTKTMIGLLPPFSARDAINSHGENSLMVALRSIDDPKRRKRMMELLVSNGASVKYLNPDNGCTLVHYSAGKIANRAVDLRWLLSRWPVEMDIAKQDFGGNNALHWAVHAGDVSIVVHLLRLAYLSFSDLDKTNSDKLTPYLLAHKLGHLEIAELIDKTASEGISTLVNYSADGPKTSSGRRSARDDNDITLPALINHCLPARFDSFQASIVRNRTAIRKLGEEERLAQSLDLAMQKRLNLILRGQPEHLPRVSLPSAIVRREREEYISRHRSLHNLSDTLALLPDYAIVHDQKLQSSIHPRTRVRKSTNSQLATNNKSK